MADFINTYQDDEEERKKQLGAVPPNPPQDQPMSLTGPGPQTQTEPETQLDPNAMVSEGEITKNTTTSRVQTPKEKTLLGNQEELDKEAIKLQERQNQLNAYKAELEKDKAAEEAQAALFRKTKQDAILAKSQKDLDEKLAQREQEYENLKELSIEDYWSDKSTGTRIMAGLAVALGAFGQGMTRSGSNSALDIIQKDMDMDFQRQRAAIEKQKDVVSELSRGISESRQAKQDALNSLGLKEAAAKDMVANKYESLLRQQGTPEAVIQGDANLLKLKQGAQDAKLKVEESLRSTNQVETEKKMVNLNTKIAEKGKTAFTTEQGLRKEFLDHPDVKSHNIVAAGYEKMKGTKDSAAGDVSLIYGFMKMNDPSSVVRETEYATAENARGIPEAIRGYFNKAKDGEKLTPEQRRQFKEQAKALMAAQTVRTNPVVEDFNRLAKEYNVDPKKVTIFTPVDITAQPKKQLSAQDQKAKAWAESNPNDPRSKKILDSLGE